MLPRGPTRLRQGRAEYRGSPVVTALASSNGALVRSSVHLLGHWTCGEIFLRLVLMAKILTAPLGCWPDACIAVKFVSTT